MPRPSGLARRLCLVTGASAGIGAALARVYAANGFDLALTARRADRLEALAAELRAAHGAQVVVIPADLADPASRREILGALGRPVDVLVNNAGYGLGGRYAKRSWEELHALLQVMLVGVCELSRAVLPGMIERDYGRILNVASVAGLIPGQAGAPLYNATKSFVVRASQSLHQETRGTGVHVTALCPGYTWSEFHDVSGGRAALTRSVPGFMWLKAEDVALAGYRAAEANQAVCVPGGVYKALVALAKIVPDDWIQAAAHRLGGRVRQV
jgi:short-subunit dehydrogenase